MHDCRSIQPTSVYAVKLYIGVVALVSFKEHTPMIIRNRRVHPPPPEETVGEGSDAAMLRNMQTS